MIFYPSNLLTVFVSFIRNNLDDQKSEYPGYKR